MSEPVVDKPEFPSEYGDPKKRLAWADVEAKLEAAAAYWLASTRPDGRPHVVPRDGIWRDGGLWYGGSPQTVHNRNVAQNPQVVAHIGDGQEVVIVEGTLEIEKPTPEMAEDLVEAMFAKYPQYGRLDPDMFMQGVSVLRPRLVLAWTNFTENATRFRFD